MTYPRRLQPDAATCPTCRATYPLTGFTVRQDGTRRAECRPCFSRHFQKLHGRRTSQWAAHFQPRRIAGDAA
ncbi:hypothetical protein [Nocardia sp. NPDC059239]|uniref:hypothetical protein n=1 Tax=unclassified Nocardia TaxID=2637762 RepID=UPI0036A34440